MDRTSKSAMSASLPSKRPKDIDFKVKFRAPGPGEYSIPSGVGKQVVSTQPSAGSTAFGTGPRDATGRANDEPGPGAYFKEAKLGASAKSTERNAPSYTLRGREKFGSTVGGTAVDTPGPGAYARIEKPSAPKPPAYSMAGRPEEVSNRGAKATPAPGRYRAPDSFGRQPVSTRRSAPGIRFGLSKRKPIIKTQSEVGPGDYRTPDSLGTQLISSKPSAPVFTFGSRPKERKLGEARNGPGSYRPLQSIGRQASSTMRSAPSISMSGRTQFGSPYNV